MLPEDRLDALLSRGFEGEWRSITRPEDEGLEPLLAAAGALRPLRAAAPSAAFTRTLETRLLARAATLTSTGVSEFTAQDDALTQANASDVTTLPHVLSIRTVARARQRASQQRRTTPHRPRFLWPAVAAAVLLLGLGTLTAAAAAAGPGNPLYGLHRLEQGVTIAFSGSPADRARLHLQYASSALASADSAAHSGDAATFDDALSTLQSELAAAASEVSNVPSGADHDALAAQLASLRTRAIADLRTDLPLLSWSQRLTTTDALAAFGDTVPRVVSATVERERNSDARTWHIVISGTGFAPGARLLVNGQPAGSVVSISSTTLVATYTAADGQPPTALGVANPDDTAAQTTHPRLSPSDEYESGTPGPSGTPGDDHGDGGGTDRGGHGGTPTPGTPTTTPTPTSTPSSDH